MIRPTRRAVLLFAGALPVPLLLLLYRPLDWPLALDAGALILLALGVDCLMVPSARRLEAAASAPAAVHIGDRAEVAVALAAPLRRQLEIELVLDLAGPAPPRAAGRARLEAGGAGRAVLAFAPLRRGRVEVARLWLRWQGPLGLMASERSLPLSQAIDVLPNVRAAYAAALPFLTRQALAGLKPQRDTGGGGEFDALREFAPGLDSRFIDWKHSARHRRLLSKEFRVERNHPVVLAFDTGHLMREPLAGLPRLDHAINAGLLLGWVALRTGDLVGSYAFDGGVRHFLQPGRGPAAFAQLQHAAAALDYGDDETNFTVGLGELQARLSRRSLVVLFTEFVDTVTAELMLDTLQRLAARHLVVFVTLADPWLAQRAAAPPEDHRRVAGAVLAYDIMRERKVVLERLQRLGVQCLDVPAGRLSAALVSRYLAIKQRDQL
jgi:uncharacterized protein (DUF58 family)